MNNKELHEKMSMFECWQTVKAREVPPGHFIASGDGAIWLTIEVENTIILKCFDSVVQAHKPGSEKTDFFNHDFYYVGPEEFPDLAELIIEEWKRESTTLNNGAKDERKS